MTVPYGPVMRLPWKRRSSAGPLVIAEWLISHEWLRWDAPRNYIAGEASYAPALTALTGPICANGYCRPVVVRFTREPRNTYDRNALRAEVAGQHVGYLRRHLAAELAPALDRGGCSSFEVPGLLRGGSTRARNVGCHVWLNRCLRPAGLAIELPRDDPEWVVPWPIHEWERPE